MRFSLKKTIFIIFLFFSALIFAQGNYLSPSFKTINLNSPIPDSIRVSELFIIPEYIRIFSDSLELKKDIDFSVREYIIIYNPLKYKHIKIEYAIFPQNYFNKFQLYEPIELADTLNVKKLKKNWESFLLDNQSLNISGSKTVSVSVSNQDMFDINQSLYLKIDGELSPNVSIQAQLNDSQSPITPEGDSRELSSLDEVFFKIYGNVYEIAFGDLDIDLYGTQFLNFQPQFEGLRLSYFDKNQTTFAIAISSSKSAYTAFNGIEGKQGPYYLKPPGTIHNVKILPGSETIWLDGLIVFRGSDYRIDYNEGSIEFNLIHFISENSRIQASFQYTDEYYKKNTLISSSDLFLAKNLKLKTAIIYQKDDKDKPLTESLSANDIEILKKVGDNKAFISGATFIGEGLGLYIQKQIIDDNNDFKEVFIYAPGDDNANFNVKFTWVGNGLGDYNQVSPSRFDYVGENLGAWLPIREIKAPELKSNYNFSLNYNYNFYNFYYETLLSEYDKNIFSKKDNKDNFSHIHHLQSTIIPEWDNFNPELNIWYRYKDKNLFTFSHIKDADESNKLYAFQEADSLKSQEIYISLKTFTFNFLNQKTTYKISNNERLINNDYLNLSQSIRQNKLFPSIAYNYTYATNKNKLIDSLQTKNEIIIHEPSSQYKLRKLTLNFNSRHYEYLTKDLNYNVLISGNKQNTYSSGFSFDQIKNSGVAFNYKNENNYFYKKSWNKLRESNTWSVQTYTQTNKHYATAMYSHRIVKSFNDYVSDQKFDIAEIRTMNSFINDGLQLNSSYIIKNVEFFPKSRELSYVGQGAGLYDSTGTWTEYGDYDWVIVNVGETDRSVEVHTNINNYTYPANFVKKNTEFYNFLNKINLESNFSIIEQTRNNNKMKVYLLFPDALNNEKTIYSRQELRQTLWYNIQRNKWISRYSIRIDNTNDNRYQENQNNKTTEQELSVRLLRVYYSDFEKNIKFRKEYDSRYELNSNTRSNELNIRTSTNHNLIFNTGLGFEQESIISRNQKQKINRYIFSEDIMIFIGEKYRFNSSFSIRFNQITNPVSVYLPFDKQKGFNSRWMIGLNYRINRISSMNFDYSGYKYPSQNAYHQVKMEVRAEF